MKFSVNTLLCLFTVGAYSAAIDSRDDTAVKEVLGKIQSGIDALTDAAKTFSGNIQPVLDESNNLIAIITDGTTTVKGAPNLTVSESLGLVSIVKTLANHAQSLDDEFKSRIPTIEAAKGCALTRGQLATITDDTNTFIDALVAKVPSAAQGVAKQQAAKITAILEDAKANLAEDKCVDAA